MTDTNYSQKGDIGESLLISELLLRGLSVSIPFGHNNLYDLVVETKDGKLLKVQVKRRIVEFNFARLGRYKEQIDVYAFLCDDTWVFFTKLMMRKRGYPEYLWINLSKVTKNNWKVFGC